MRRFRFFGVNSKPLVKALYLRKTTGPTKEMRLAALGVDPMEEVDVLETPQRIDPTTPSLGRQMLRPVLLYCFLFGGIQAFGWWCLAMQARRRGLFFVIGLPANLAVSTVTRASCPVREEL